MKRGIFICLLVLQSYFSYSQKSLDYFLKKINEQSYFAEFNKNKLAIANITYANFKLGYRPSINVSGNIPSFNKDNIAVIQPDGSVNFTSRSQGNSMLSMGLSQPIPFTGGTISLNTDLARFDDFARKVTRYNGTPVFIRLNQSLFFYNRFKWDSRIEPLKLKEANLLFKESMLLKEYEVCKSFFDIAQSQTELQLAETNLENNILNLSIEKRRVQIGSSTEDKVLQLEMQQVIYQQRAIAARLAIKSASITLKSIINDTGSIISGVSLPTKIPVLNLDEEQLLSNLKVNKTLFTYYERRKLEAKSNIAKVKTQGRQIDMTLSYGLNNAEATIAELYKNPNNQQRFNITFSIPMVDWGRRKNNINLAYLQEKDIDASKKIEESKVVAEAKSIIYQLPLFAGNLNSALRLDTLANKRYIIANRLYQLGKISLVELQNAEVDKDNATRSYVYALRQFWESYYLLRASIMSDL